MYTDEHGDYRRKPFDRETICHRVSECCRKQTQMQRIKPFGLFRKGTYMGTFHKCLPTQLNRYVTGYAGHYHDRAANALDIISRVASGLAGEPLRDSDVIADNGFTSGAR